MVSATFNASLVQSDLWRSWQTLELGTLVRVYPTTVCLFWGVAGALLYLDLAASDTIWAFYALVLFVFAVTLGLCSVLTQLPGGSHLKLKWGMWESTQPLNQGFVWRHTTCLSVCEIFVHPDLFLSFPFFPTSSSWLSQKPSTVLLFSAKTTLSFLWLETVYLDWWLEEMGGIHPTPCRSGVLRLSLRGDKQAR